MGIKEMTDGNFRGNIAKWNF